MSEPDFRCLAPHDAPQSPIAAFAYMDVGKGREQEAVSFAYMDVGKGREQDAVSLTALGNRTTIARDRVLLQVSDAAFYLHPLFNTLH